MFLPDPHFVGGQSLALPNNWASVSTHYMNNVWTHNY